MFGEIVKFVWLDFVLFMSLAAISDLSLKFVDLLTSESVFVALSSCVSVREILLNFVIHILFASDRYTLLSVLSVEQLYDDLIT